MPKSFSKAGLKVDDKVQDEEYARKCKALALEYHKELI